MMTRWNMSPTTRELLDSLKPRHRKEAAMRTGIDLFKAAAAEPFGGKMAPPFGKKKKETDVKAEPKEEGVPKKAENMMDNAGASATPGVLNARGSGMAPTDTASATERAIASDKDQMDKKRKAGQMPKTAEEIKKEAELANQLVAFEGGMDVYFAENGLTKESVAKRANELGGRVSPESLVTETVKWLSNQASAQAQSQQ